MKSLKLYIFVASLDLHIRLQDQIRALSDVIGVIMLHYVGVDFAHVCVCLCDLLLSTVWFRHTF